MFAMKVLSLALLFLCIYSAPRCQQQYGLLIGINNYQPPKNAVVSDNRGRMQFENLQGCRNDMEAMYGIIKSKFNFSAPNIDTLADEAATRDAILKALNNLLLKCKPGDVAFIYYAGHGSQVRNSLSTNKVDMMDETIVPADTWKEGVRDIRDKELSKIFNAFIDNKIKLTVIFDCCHSGSISKGPNLKPGKVRFMPGENWDSKDSSSPLVPESRAGGNFLIFSAAQADENAAEQLEYVDNTTYIPHGAFTLALTEALRQHPNDASASAIFMSARAILKNNGATQEPVMGGLPERQEQTLFSIGKGKLSEYSTIAVSAIKDDRVILEGGWALGLYRQNELAMLDDNKDTVFKLVIEDVTGVNKCEASVLTGDIKKIMPGFLFKVTNWASGDIPLLNIYIPASPYTNADVNKIAALAAQLKKSAQVKWLENFKNAAPFASVFFDKGKGYIKIARTAPKEITNLSAQYIISLCADSTLYFEIPVSKDSAAAFIHALKPNYNINIVDDIEAANYCLYGKLGKNGLPAYGFRKVRINAADSLEAMPLFTDCFEYAYKSSKSVADSLCETAKKLSKLRGWLNIIETPQGDSKIFPFHLEFMNMDTKQILHGKYSIGDSVRPLIVADDDFHQYESSLNQKYVYVFGVDQSGTISLYYPGRGNGSVGNRFPVYNQGKLADSIRIYFPYRVGLPTGTDNFFMLATEDAIPNPDRLFNQAGVTSDPFSRGVDKNAYGKNPLAALLDIGNFNSNTGARGLPPGTLPANWSVQKFSFTCTYPQGGK